MFYVFYETSLSSIWRRSCCYVMMRSESGEMEKSYICEQQLPNFHI